MDSTINGKKVHINNPLDLIGLGRREIEFNIPKTDYWEMFKETMQVPTMKRGGYKNLLKGGWVFVDPYNQGKDLWTKEYFTKAGASEPCWTGFPSSGDIFDYGAYESGYYGFKCPDTKNEEDYSKYNQLNILKPNTTYTWQWDMKRTTSSIKGDMETFMGTSGNTIIDLTKPVYVNGESYQKAENSPDGFVSWNRRINSDDTSWHRCVFVFTTKSTLPNAGSRSLRWRAKKDSSWKVKNIMMFEGSELLGTEFRLHEQEYYDWTFYEGRQGMREVSANFGFYYSEDYAFCSAFKVNIHKGFETRGFNPVTQEFECKAEVENFAQIVNPTIKYYQDIKQIPDNVNWNNTIIYNPKPNGIDYLQCKAKGNYMSLYKVRDNNYSSYVPKRWQATFFDSVPSGKWLYGGYCYTGTLQTYEIEN